MPNPEKLHQFAKVSAYFGGEFDLIKMNFFERLVVKKVAHVQESVSKIDHGDIKYFWVKMDKIFNPFLYLA